MILKQQGGSAIHLPYPMAKQTLGHSNGIQLPNQTTIFGLQILYCTQAKVAAVKLDSPAKDGQWVEWMQGEGGFVLFT